SKLNTIFDSAENAWKLSVGPTCEIPGPTLFIVVKTPLNDVAKSKLSSETSSTDTIMINTYAEK
ncbi:hypothetical protein, partial [Anaerofustis stercorihominis]|uniref:hypothetical protein n=1 Tax=Anaerofustis stercorihominis TaxID=214853 RepID=UPI0034E609A5